MALFRFLRSQKIRSFLLTAALVCAAAALIAAPGEAMVGAKEGLKLCFNVIVPSLFPFFVLSSLVVDLGLAAKLGQCLEKWMRPLFRVSGSCAAALVLGFVGGYPVGARTALQLYEQGQCTKTETERLLAFCNNSGPAFILGVVGAGIFEDSLVGILLYLTHAITSLLVGLIFRFYGNDSDTASSRRSKPIQTVRLSTAFTHAVTGALQSILNICAFVTFFSVVLRLFTVYGVLSAMTRLLGLFGFQPEWARRLIAGLLELSSGVSSLSGGRGLAGLASMAAFMLGWAGLSVHCQVLSFLSDSGLSTKTYIAGKLLHGLLAAALTWLLVRFIPIDEPVSLYLAEQINCLPESDFLTVLSLSAGAALLLGIALVISLLKLRKRGGKIPPHPIY